MTKLPCSAKQGVLRESPVEAAEQIITSSRITNVSKVDGRGQEEAWAANRLMPLNQVLSSLDPCVGKMGESAWGVAERRVGFE